VHYSLAEDALRTFAERHNIPVVETVAGKATLVSAHPLNAGPIGSTGCTSANAMAAEADVVLAVGTRLQDFTTGSWTVFANEAVKIIGLNTATFDACEAPRAPLVADAREGLSELDALVGDWRFDEWTDKAHVEIASTTLHRQDRQPGPRWRRRLRTRR
jgi:3D-(3,5/4)-trihydroxycyclohexane-1,2-dione acylhydrolase (decyclizing)